MKKEQSHRKQNLDTLKEQLNCVIDSYKSHSGADISVLEDLSYLIETFIEEDRQDIDFQEFAAFDYDDIDL